MSPTICARAMLVPTATTGAEGVRHVWRRRRTWLARAALALAILVTGRAHESEAAFPGTNGKIAYYYQGTDGLHVVNPDGSDSQKIVSGTGRWRSPAWSPDGKRFAVSLWAVNPIYGYEIWTVDADGTNAERITFLNDGDPGSGYTPAWSPDGKEIAFQCVEQTPGSQATLRICVVDVVSKQMRYVVGAEYAGGDPVWSPNGDVIVYAGVHKVQVNGHDEDWYDLFSVAPGGGNSTPLTHSPDAEWAPDFSPDGSKIVVELRAGENRGLGIVAAGGGAVTQVTNGLDSSPTWSPDGTKIAFERVVSLNNNQLMVLDVERPEAPVQITDKPYGCQDPHWGPGQAVLEATIVATPASIALGEPFTVTITAKNTGDAELTNVQPAGPLTLEGEGQAEITSGPVPASVATLAPHASQTFVYQLDSTVAGALVVKGQVQGKTLQDETVTAEARCGIGAPASIRGSPRAASDEPAPPVCPVGGGTQVEIVACRIELVDISLPRRLDRLSAHGDSVPPPGTDTPPGGT